MYLYLIRHGEAVSKGIDPERPLSDKGRADVARVAAMLKASSINVNKTFHSGKTRARQTAEIFCTELSCNHVEAITGINPNDPIEPFVDQLNDWSGDTLVVGHLPFMAKLVSYLVIENEQPILTAYQSGSVVCLARDEEDHWQIQWMITPEIVKDDLPQSSQS